MPKKMQTQIGWKLSLEEEKLFKALNSPGKVQDYLDGLAINFDDDDDTCSSPRVVIRRGSAHCIEAALLATAILIYHGQEAWLLDLKANARDLDHVVCLFKRKGRWGAISKTRYLALRFREPVYSSVRELAMSCFHEYINKHGEKTLRSYSAPFSLKRYGSNWIISQDNLWLIANELDESRHFAIVPKGLRLRKAGKFEAWASEITEWEKTKAGPRKRKLRL
jgi:hypothetical protein